MELINKNQKKLNDVCSKFNVTELFVFGSILNQNFNDESDIDFLVSIAEQDPLEYAENYFALKFALEKLFKRRVDLLEHRAIKNKTFENLINQKKMLVYASRNKNVA